MASATPDYYPIFFSSYTWLKQLVIYNICHWYVVFPFTVQRLFCHFCPAYPVFNSTVNWNYCSHFAVVSNVSCFYFVNIYIFFESFTTLKSPEYKSNKSMDPSTAIQKFWSWFVFHHFVMKWFVVLECFLFILGRWEVYLRCASHNILTISNILYPTYYKYPMKEYWLSIFFKVSWKFQPLTNGRRINPFLFYVSPAIIFNGWQSVEEHYRKWKMRKI